MRRLLTQTFSVVCALFFASCETYELSESGRLVPLTVDEDSSLPSIFVNNAQLHSKTFGNPDDPILLVVHGGPGADFRSNLNYQHLADAGYYVVFYDQRGSGLSQRFDSDIYTVDIYVDDLQAVINHYRQSPDQPLFLAGHSWGAMLSTAFIDRFPDQITGAILVEPGGFTWSDTEDYVIRSRPLKLFDETTNDFVYQDQFLSGDDHATLDFKAGLAAAAGIAEGNAVGVLDPTPFWRIGAVCGSASIQHVVDHPFDFTQDLHRYTTKVLFVYSELNTAYGREHAELVSSAYPNADLVKVDGVGHEVPHEAWEKLEPLALRYLNEFK